MSLLINYSLIQQITSTNLDRRNAVNYTKSDMIRFLANSKTRRRREQKNGHGTIRASLIIDNDT